MGFIIENEYLLVEAREEGAQMVRIYDKKKERELLWHGDPAVWRFCAPVLFPIVGKVSGGSYRLGEESYSLGQHGFARTSRFSLAEKEADHVSFTLTDSEETKKVYPFAFSLTVSHSLMGPSVRQEYRVKNTDRDNTLYFSIGAHPAFLCPPPGETDRFACSLLFEGKTALSYITPDLTSGLAKGEPRHDLEIPKGRLPISEHMFDIDTFIFEDGQVQKVSLCGAQGKPYITVSSPLFPDFGIWSPSDRSGFVCLEPWFGHADMAGFEGDFREKKGIISLAPGEIFEAGFDITVG